MILSLPGVTNRSRNMPGEAAAKVKMAVSRSHTTVAADDNTALRWTDPGYALVRSTGDPAFRYFSKLGESEFAVT